MREIKFRAWDRELKELRRVTLMEFPEWSVCTQGPDYKYYEIGDRNSFKNEQTDRCILMQYTGLKDKNGKEIYEGDIVSIETWYGDAKVFWDEGSWWASPDYPRCNRRLLARTDEQKEIVGNIYENPELIASEPPPAP